MDIQTFLTEEFGQTILEYDIHPDFLNLHLSPIQLQIVKEFFETILRVESALINQANTAFTIMNITPLIRNKLNGVIKFATFMNTSYNTSGNEIKRQLARCLHEMQHQTQHLSNPFFYSKHGPRMGQAKQIETCLSNSGWTSSLYTRTSRPNFRKKSFKSKESKHWIRSSIFEKTK